MWSHQVVVGKGDVLSTTLLENSNVMHARMVVYVPQQHGCVQHILSLRNDVVDA
jgi:hypothetical protein